jgi:hypothetical protein
MLDIMCVFFDSIKTISLEISLHIIRQKMQKKHFPSCILFLQCPVYMADTKVCIRHMQRFIL